MEFKALKYFIGVVLLMTASNATLALANGDMPGSFASIVEKTMPAVVNISTTQNLEGRNPLEDLRGDIPEGSPFDHFFKEFLDREFGFPETRRRKATSLGSGFIFHADGYVATNSHVIEGADEITVTLSNDPEKTFTAKIIGSDKKADLAVLKIESKTPLPFLKFGNEDKAKVGDWIIAIGNPFGLGGTVTAGIISAKSRVINGFYDEFIQTDASINRGNSGGPMINMDGEVIGINTVIMTPSGGNVGIGFSLPSNQAQMVVEQLKSSGKIVRGWMGVGIQTLNEDIAKNIGIPKDVKGVLVTQVMKDSPAEKAGIKIGDVITSFNGAAVTQTLKLSKIVAETTVGSKVGVDIIRDGKAAKLTLVVELLNNKVDDEPLKSKDKGDLSIIATLGIKLENLSTPLRNKFKVEPKIEGVIITGINRNSLAAEAGLMVGDVIMQINKVKVDNVIKANSEIDAAKKANSKNVVFLINRNSSSHFVVLELE